MCRRLFTEVSHRLQGSWDEALSSTRLSSARSRARDMGGIVERQGSEVRGQFAATSGELTSLSPPRPTAVQCRRVRGFRPRAS